MRLIELEINNIRGIKNLKIQPNGNNFVVWGANGSGKSAVIDSLDFLLTGKVSRLIGAGTKGIMLTKHGPHIDHSPQEAYVRALIKVKNHEQPIEVKRSMANSSLLECEDSHKPIVEAVEKFAQRGQHVLTRREILKFITSEKLF